VYAARTDNDEKPAGGVATLNDGNGFIAACYDGLFGGVCLANFVLEEVGCRERVEAFHAVVFEGGSVAAGRVCDEEGHVVGDDAGMILWSEVKKRWRVCMVEGQDKRVTLTFYPAYFSQSNQFATIGVYPNNHFHNGNIFYLNPYLMITISADTHGNL